MLKNKKLLISGVAVLILPALFFLKNGKNTENTVDVLARPSYSEKETVYELNAKVLDEEIPLSIPVSPVRIPKEKLPELFSKAYEIMLSKLKGKNKSLSEITENLVFPEEIEECGVKADYSLEDYSVINCFGEVDNSELPEPYEISLFTEFSYAEETKVFETPLTVLPKTLTGQEAQKKEILREIAKQEDGNPYDDTLALPKTVGDLQLSFSEKKEDSSKFIFLVIVLGLAAFLYWKFILPKNNQKKREAELMLDYSEIVTKITLLMSAGLSSKSAISKMAKDYEKKKSAKYKRVSYEELTELANRLAMGTYEPSAYKDFGRKCGLHPYIKLSNMLSQNIQKGSAGFMENLKFEVTESFEKRKALAVKTGEEAGTKLLFPMIMMLVITMAVIIIPAFMSF